MMQFKEAVVLLSGGMDSATALAETLEDLDPIEVLTLSFNYGQRHRDMELQAAKQIAEHYRVEHHVLNLSQLQTLLGGSALTDRSISVPNGHYTDETMAITVVPNRNAIMLSIAFGVARARAANTVVAGMHAGDHAIYPDCRPAFVHAFQRMEDAANDDLGPTQRVHLSTPFINESKWDIVMTGAELEVPYHLTYSCYNGRLLHCGTCGTCVERREAFEKAGVDDPTNYAPTEGARA